MVCPWVLGRPGAASWAAPVQQAAVAVAAVGAAAVAAVAVVLLVPAGLL